ncbi:MAG: PAS domain S-box protein, partial [Planctomycetaceae bacterium]|nr:PAS domain S-box protein [Planctomycetaceae bacterium]
ERLGAQTPKEILGKMDEDFFAEEYVKVSRLDEENLLAGGTAIVGKEENPDWPDGTQSWVSSTKIALRNDQGDVLGLLGISHDITAQKESEDQLRGVLEAAPVALIAVDRTGVIRFVNSQCEELFGYTRNEVVGKAIEVLVPKSIRERHVALRNEYLKAPYTGFLGQDRDIIVENRDGHKFPVEIGLSLLKAKSETYVLACVHNLTLLREAEEAIRLSEERFALAVKGSTDGLWDWNILTNEVYYAPRFKHLLGFADEEFPNTFASFESHLHADDLERVLAALDNHLNHDIPYDVEYRLRTKSGDYRHFRARGQAIWNDEGKATRMAGSITDITRRKLAEEELAKIAMRLALPRESHSKAGDRFVLSEFSLKDMISCGSQIRGLSLTRANSRQFHNGLVRLLYDRIKDDHQNRAFALV